MMKFNKDYTLKIIFATISITLSFTNTLYSSQFSRENLRIEIGVRDDTYRRMDEVYALSSTNYDNFLHWLENIPLDKLENTVVFLDVLETLLKALTDPYSDARRANAKALKALFWKGLVSKEEVKEKKVLETLRKGITDPHSGVRRTNAETLRALVDTGLVSKEEVKEKKILETLEGFTDDPDSGVHKVNAEIVKPLTDSYSDARRAKAETLKAKIDKGLVSKEEVKEKKVLETLRKGLTDPYSDVRRANAETLRALVDTGLVSKEVRFSGEEIESMFREVYERGIPAPGSVHYYLKIFNILKDNPFAAYQIFNWNIEELSELFRIFYYFAKGAALDLSYEEETGEKYLLEKELIKGGMVFLRTPKIFIRHLKYKIKATIGDNSVKLAIKVHEVASANAARGLIKALGLDKENVVILYDKEIDSGHAERFFQGYDIRAYSGFTGEGVIRIEFHDYGNLVIKSSGNSLSASLSYTPFKFNLPERVPEEELDKMRKSLGIGSRKVIVIGSPSEAEFNEFIQSYNALYGKLTYEERPLLIIGFRQRASGDETRLLVSTSGQSVAVRNDDKAPLPDVKRNNVLILDTSGELLRMYALADVAIVGHDKNIFEPASQKTAVLYFDGSWHNNRDAKRVLAEIGAAQIFSRERLDELIRNPDKARKMAVDGFEAVEAYRKEVLSGAEAVALQIIGATKQRRDKFITAFSPVNGIEQIVVKIKNGTPLSPQEMQGLGFRSNEELFLWINSAVNENRELVERGLHLFDRNNIFASGGQSNFITNPENPDYGLKVVQQNYADMPIENTIRAFRLSQERLGGLVTPFFLPSGFNTRHEAAVQIVPLLRDEDISEKGEAFVDEYLLLIEAYWKRGVFDHDFKLNGLGAIGEEKRLIVIDFGLSEDTLNEGLFIAPTDKGERFWNTFNIAIDKLHNTRDKLKQISPAIAEYFEDQLEKRYEIKLFPIWDRSMRGGDNATELAGKLRNVVRRFCPQLATPIYVFPFIGGEFDRFILFKIEERYEQYHTPAVSVSQTDLDTQRLLMLNI